MGKTTIDLQDVNEHVYAGTSNLFDGIVRFLAVILKNTARAVPRIAMGDKHTKKRYAVAGNHEHWDLREDLETFCHEHTCVEPEDGKFGEACCDKPSHSGNE